MNGEGQPRPRFRATNIRYELAERTAAMNGGGSGVMPWMLQRLGRVNDLEGNVPLLKVSLPYHESDQVLNIACNILAGGVGLEDTERRRQDEVFLNGTRLKVWKVQPKGFPQDAFADVAGTLAQTYGECRPRMDICAKGIWGHAPLIASLANTNEGLDRVNRPGNAASHSGSVAKMAARGKESTRHARPSATPAGERVCRQARAGRIV